MNTMKFFLRFLIAFVALYIFVDVFTFIYIKNTYNEIENYYIIKDSPKIEVIEAKTTNMNGYIKGRFINDTSKDIGTMYITTSFKSKKGNDLGTSMMEITNIKVGEEKEFEVKYKLSNVGSFVIGTSKEKIANTTTTEIKFDEFESKGFIITGILTKLYMIL